MFNWIRENFKEIEKALVDIEGFKFEVKSSYSGGIQGVSVNLPGEKKAYTTTEELRKDFNFKKYTILIPGAQDTYVDGVIVYLRGLPYPVILTDSDRIPVSNKKSPCLILIYLNSATRQRPTVVYEDPHEAEFYKQAEKISGIEETIKNIKEFLDDPWKEYRAKEMDFKQKLGKAEAATKYKIEKSKEDLVALEKQLEEEKNILIENFKNGKG